MLIQHAIWKVGAKPEPLSVSKLATERPTLNIEVKRRTFGGMIDLPAIAPEPRRGYAMQGASIRDG